MHVIKVHIILGLSYLPEHDCLYRTSALILKGITCDLDCFYDMQNERDFSKTFMFWLPTIRGYENTS